MGTNLRAKADLSQLIVIDMQARLGMVMPQEPLQTTINNISILMQAANLLAVPAVITEQYPKGLGHTVPELLSLMPSNPPVAKIAFSCMAEPKFSRQLTRDRSQVILTGMEAHICVLQSALDMLESDKQVFVVEDAIISRNATNKANAIARMRAAGCIVGNTESIVFEWLGKAEGDAFKAISKLIR